MQDRPPGTQQPPPPTPSGPRPEWSEQLRRTIEAAQAATGRQTDAPTPRPEVTVQRVTWDPNNFDIPPRLAELGEAFFFMLFAVIVGIPIARAFARSIDRRAQAPSRPSAQVTAQLTQLTQSVDAIAIEVERISEGQRFTTKLLSDLQSKRGSMLPSETIGSRAAE